MEMSSVLDILNMRDLQDVLEEILGRHEQLDKWVWR